MPWHVVARLSVALRCLSQGCSACHTVASPVTGLHPLSQGCIPCRVAAPVIAGTAPAPPTVAATARGDALSPPPTLSANSGARAGAWLFPLVGLKKAVANKLCAAVVGSGGGRAAAAAGMERPGAAREGLGTSELDRKGPGTGVWGVRPPGACGGGGERSYEALGREGAATCGPFGAGTLWGGRGFCGSAGLEVGRDEPVGRVSGAAWGAWEGG